MNKHPILIGTSVGFVITWIIVFTYFHFVPVPEQLGGVNPSKGGTLVCWEYPADHQKICFESFDTWFGQDVRHIYLLDADGVKHPL